MLLGTCVGLANCVLLSCNQEQEQAVLPDEEINAPVAQLTADISPPKSSTVEPAVESAPPAQLINVNTATAKELAQLPKIGDVLAKRIVDGRPYGATDDLLEVEGLGKGTLKVIHELISVE